MIEPVQALNRGSDAEVADRQDVGPLEVDQQKHVGGPPPKPFAGRDLLANLVIRELVQVLYVELASNDMFGQRPEILDLHPGESHSFQGGGIEGQQLGRGGHPAAKALLEPTGYRPRREARNLLADDRGNEDAEGITQRTAAPPGGGIDGLGRTDQARQSAVTGLQGGQRVIARRGGLCASDSSS